MKMRYIAATMAMIGLSTLGQTAANAETGANQPIQTVNIPVSVDINDSDNGIICSWSASTSLTPTNLAVGSKFGDINCTNPGSKTVVVANDYTGTTDGSVRLVPTGTAGGASSLNGALITPTGAPLTQRLDGADIVGSKTISMGPGADTTISLVLAGTPVATPGKYNGVVHLSVWNA
ncbi:hypothetical protein LGI69_002934 [Salmonella enterica]|nr:hypothetical protein [Salmonella enterica]